MVRITSEIRCSFEAALPQVRKWIGHTLSEHAGQAVAVAKFNLAGLERRFPKKLLQEAKVILAKPLPELPFQVLGLADLGLEMPPRDAITLKDTFFVRPENCHDEGLYFHELVHVVQWQRLGVDRFIKAYGVGLLCYGYTNSPLEKMAFRLQHEFEQQTDPPNLIGVIQEETDFIWKEVDSAWERPSER